MQSLSFKKSLFNGDGVARRELRVLERCCCFDMCLDIEYFVPREAWSFENFGISENSAFGRQFTCEFDCGIESVSKINETSDFLFA